MASVPDLDELLSGQDHAAPDCAQLLHRLAAMLAGEIACSSVSLRVVIVAKTQLILRTVAQYEVAPGKRADFPDVAGDDIKDYLDSVVRGGGLAAWQLEADARVPLALRECLAERGVRSILDAPISLDGMIYGTLTCEEDREPTQWSPSQVHAVRRLAASVGPAVVRLVAEHLLSHEQGRLAPISRLAS